MIKKILTQRRIPLLLLVISFTIFSLFYLCYTFCYAKRGR